jgi:chromosome segregation ATPase
LFDRAIESKLQTFTLKHEAKRSRHKAERLHSAQEHYNWGRAEKRSLDPDVHSRPVPTLRASPSAQQGGSAADEPAAAAAQPIDEFTTVEQQLLREREQMVIELERLEHKLWFSEHFSGELEHLVRSVQRENREWRAKFTEASSYVAQLHRAEERAQAADHASSASSARAHSAEEVAEETRGKLRMADKQLLAVSDQLLQADMARQDAQDLRLHEHRASQQEIERLSEQLALLGAELQNKAKELAHIKRNVKQFKEAFHEDEKVIAKFSAPKKYREKNPIPIHLLDFTVEQSNNSKKRETAASKVAPRKS